MVRLMLVLFIILGLATKKVNFMAAFIHALTDRNPYWDKMTEDEWSKSWVYIINMPREDFQSTEKC
jgi:hypothetical protein